jgi:hypothetical protein
VVAAADHRAIFTVPVAGELASLAPDPTAQLPTTRICRGLGNLVPWC